jgi:hypothetical protein
MAIREVTMYRIVCDRCGTSAQDDGEFYAWADKDSPIAEAEDSDWLLTDAGDYCHRCWTWDDEGENKIPDPRPVEASAAGKGSR